MSTLMVFERVCTCPACHADNTLISESLPPHTPVVCSHCGASIGTVADMRDAYVPIARATKLDPSETGSIARR